MLQLNQLTEEIPADELGQIMTAFTIAGELEADACNELLFRTNGSADTRAIVEQLHDAAELREVYVKRLIVLARNGS